MDTYKGARPLLEAIAEHGFAPIAKPYNPIVEMIVKMNIGGVVTKKTAVIMMPRAKWESTSFLYALIPSSESVRLEIARTQHTVPASRLRGRLVVVKLWKRFVTLIRVAG